MYYEVSVYYKGTEEDCFKIDKDELMAFVNFLTTRINNLQCINIIVHGVEKPNNSTQV